jgi:hypothetical protein
MPADEEEERSGEQLPLAETVAVLLGGDQRREQVLARRGPAAAGEVGEVVVEGVSGRADLGPLRRAHELPRVREGGEDAGPSLQRGAIGCRHAQQLADDHHRQRVGQLCDDVHAAVTTFLDRIEEPIDPISNAGAQPLDGAQGERLAHQPA